jgi:hypothetical protein
VNRDETKRVLREIAASWRAELTDDQVVVWASTVSRWSLPVALETVKLLRESSDRFPTHAQFKNLAAQVARRHNSGRPALPPEADQLQFDEAKEVAIAGGWLARCREQLAKATKPDTGEGERQAS